MIHFINNNNNNNHDDNNNETYAYAVVVLNEINIST